LLTVNKANENKVSEGAIRQELTRILQSPIFAQSERLGRFLRFTVEHAIGGKEDGLKEYVIGTEVYDRKPPYHPSQDSIVRTEARRLRTKLKEYYETVGKDDAIFIYFRPGSYLPVFRPRDLSALDDADGAGSDRELFVYGEGVSIAVIPFLDVSGQTLSAAYARGVTDELVHELMHSEGCRVIAASAIAQLGSQVSDIPALARKLGVQIVFEGTVREEGTRIRVTSRIVNADGFQIWSQRFDAEADSSSLFTVQEQFASALVNRVRPQLSIVRTAQASAGPGILALYPALLKGEALLEEGTAADVQASFVKFRELTQTAPGYARPYCGIARGYCWLALHGAYRSADLVVHARAAAERAVELDPEMAESISALACVQALEWNWSGAENTFSQVIESGGHATNSRQYAMLLSVLGRFDEAWMYLEAAQQIDPFSYLQKVACVKFFYVSRRYEEALQHFSEPLRYGPLPSEAQLYLALIHAQLGKQDEAKRLVLLVQRNAGAQLSLKSWIAEILARCGESGAAKSIVDEFKLLSPATLLSRFRQALLSIALDDQEGALSLLSKAYEEKEAELPYLAVDPRFDPIRQTSRFNEIVEGIRSRTTS
jgi:TolB-like protein/tetratricopeptide (TPR) repeat protein